MTIPTEPIGSVPRPSDLIAGAQAFSEARISRSELEALYQHAIRDTISRFEATGSPIITDGEQSKPSFATYPIHGLANLAPDGVKIPFADGHSRQLPRLTAGPFRYRVFCDSYLDDAQKHTTPTQAGRDLRVRAEPAVSAGGHRGVFAGGVPRRSRERGRKRDIRRCLQKGARSVQVDFTEGRLSIKLDPSKGLLRQFIGLNNRVLSRVPATRLR